MRIKEFLVRLHIVLSREQKIELAFSQVLLQIAQDDILLKLSWVLRVNVLSSQLFFFLLENESFFSFRLFAFLMFFEFNPKQSVVIAHQRENDLVPVFGASVEIYLASIILEEIRFEVVIEHHIEANHLNPIILIDLISVLSFSQQVLVHDQSFDDYVIDLCLHLSCTFPVSLLKLC